MNRLELIATAAFGLESVVARELHDLGYTQQQVEDGRVTFVGGELAICRTNLWLRTADRVLVKVVNDRGAQGLTLRFVGDGLRVSRTPEGKP